MRLHLKRQPPLTALELKIFKRKKNRKKQNKTNVYTIQAYDSIICRYFSIGFIDFMLKGKSLLDYASSFSPNEYEKNRGLASIAYKFLIKNLKLVGLKLRICQTKN